MPEAARIEDQLKRALEGEAWHGPSVLELLADVTPAQAAAKPLPGAHSIWEIVVHITAWVAAVRGRLGGQPIDLSPEQDWPAVRDTSKAAWARSVEALKTAHQDLRFAISLLDDSRLNDIVPGKRYSIYFMLHGVIQHDLYHAGQIALLKKVV